MADNNFNGVIDSLMKGMNTVLSAKTIVGEPTKIGDTIILPFMDMTFGVAAGASAGEKKNGGAGAFSGKLSPSAVLVVKGGMTKLVNIRNQDSLTKILDMLPDLIDKYANPKPDIIDDDEAIDIAFPSSDTTY
ncbi:MAG: GerW family sporulation protein [Lachnospiraceae bacterium]|jgi:uncharacterized spore protein YtfJ|nr:GerW family sporulation protein [Lachnospiraceae bacterium]